MTIKTYLKTILTKRIDISALILSIIALIVSIIILIISIIN